MSVLLINPCYDKQKALGFFAQYIPSQLPLSVGFIAGYLEAKGVRAHIIDEQLGLLTENRLDELIRRHNIRIVGITVLTLTAARTYEICGMIRRNWPEVKIVLGGIHITILPEEPLRDNMADVSVVGEGELTGYELVDAILNGRSLREVRGIAFREEGEIVFNPAREMVSDLDALPPFPFHLFEKDQDRYVFGNMLTARGCPHKCIFCSQKSLGGKRYRTKSPENIVREMELLVYRYHQDFIFFNNDNFIMDRTHCYELCDLIIKKNFPKNLKIGINARCDLVDPDILERMKRAHIHVVVFGLETGSERIITLIKKGESVQCCAEAVRMAKKAGLLTSGQYIVGFPTETREESLQTVKLAFRLPLDFTRFNLLVPYPGTEVYEMIQREEGPLTSNWSNYATHSGLTEQSIVYVPKGRTAKELKRLQWIANLLFYLRPRQIWMLRHIRYGLTNQIIIPEPTSIKGVYEFIKFAVLIVAYTAKNIVTRVKS